MARYETSIIIPLYNQWEHTRNCLKALAETLRGEAVEVIAVDNASQDITPQGCPVLGKDLFGDSFRYIRCERNINFGPASNLGAETAQGKFLLFLNNDTIPLAGWYRPLLEDFARHPNLGATGPLLLYPPRPVLGPTIQHLGVYISPLLTVGHLYEGIPAASPVVRKRRFFQVITAACLLIPKRLFIETGCFDEEYRNGFEDVDFCARLSAAGHRLTVNPEAKVVHFQGQSAGRHDADRENSRIFNRKARHLLEPDWHTLVANDGLTPTVNTWQNLQPLAAGNACGGDAPIDKILEAVIVQPFFRENWDLLAAKCDGPEKLEVSTSFYRLFPGADSALAGYRAAGSNSAAAAMWFNTVANYCHNRGFYRKEAGRKEQVCMDNGVETMADAFASWLTNEARFNDGPYRQFMEDFWKILVATQKDLPPCQPWAYEAWYWKREEMPKPEIPQGRFHVAIIVPGIPGERENLVQSLLAQTWQDWEAWPGATAEYDDTRIHMGKLPTEAHLVDFTHILLLAPDAILAENALIHMANAVANSPRALIFYGDSDRVTPAGSHIQPFFRSEWNREPQEWHILGPALVDKHRLFSISSFATHSIEEILAEFTRGMKAEDAVHIPHMLCHFPIHEREWEKQASDACASALETGRNVPMFSLVFHLQGKVDPKMIEGWLEKSCGPIEIILVGKAEETAEIGRFSELVRMETLMEGGEAFAEGVKYAKGSIFGFFSANLVPTHKTWAGLVARALESGGACAGKIYKNGKLVDMGLETGANGQFSPLSGSLPTSEDALLHGAYSRAIPAVSSLSLFTPMATWLELGGFRPGLESGIFADYCVRLWKMGKPAQFCSNVEFKLLGRLPVRQMREAEKELNSLHGGSIAPFNPALNIVNGQFVLAAK